MVYFDIELVGISLPAIGFLIASLLMFKNAGTYRDIEETFRINLYFAIGYIFQAIGYSFWVYRLLIYPPNVQSFMPEYGTIDLFFKLAYTFSGIGIPFITFFSISLTRGLDFFQKYKWVYVIPFIPFLYLFYLVFFVITLNPVYYGLNSTLDFTFNLGDPTGLFISAYIISLLIVPDSAFIYYLKKIGRQSPHFRRVLIITLGLITYSIFMVLEGGKFITALIFYVRIGTFIGMIILIYGLYFMKVQKGD